MIIFTRKCSRYRVSKVQKPTFATSSTWWPSLGYRLLHFRTITASSLHELFVKPATCTVKQDYSEISRDRLISRPHPTPHTHDHASHAFPIGTVKQEPKIKFRTTQPLQNNYTSSVEGSELTKVKERISAGDDDRSTNLCEELQGIVRPEM